MDEVTVVGLNQRAGMLKVIERKSHGLHQDLELLLVQQLDLSDSLFLCLVYFNLSLLTFEHSNYDSTEVLDPLSPSGESDDAVLEYLLLLSERNTTLVILVG